MKFNPLGFWFWFSFGAIWGGDELVGWLTGNSGITLSYQIWWILFHIPLWAFALIATAYTIGAIILGFHFFMKRFSSRP